MCNLCKSDYYIKIYWTYFRIIFCIADSTKVTNLDIVIADCTTASNSL